MSTTWAHRQWHTFRLRMKIVFLWEVELRFAEPAPFSAPPLLGFSARGAATGSGIASVYLGFRPSATGLAPHASPDRDLPSRTARLATSPIYITRGASLNDNSLLSHAHSPLSPSIMFRRHSFPDPLTWLLPAENSASRTQPASPLAEIWSRRSGPASHPDRP